MLIVYHIYIGIVCYLNSLEFPCELGKYGLTEQLLEEAFANQCDFTECWSLSEIPTVGFYRELHCFLKKWPPTLSVTKTTIGRFYMSIDAELKRKGSRPDNVYQFIEKVATSKKLSSTVMSYGLHATIQHLQKEAKGCSEQAQKLSAKLNEQENELSAMKTEIEVADRELHDAKCALADLGKKLRIAQKQRATARCQLHKTQANFEATVTDAVHFEEEVLVENHALMEMVNSLQKEVKALSSSDVSLQTKGGGKMYSPAIRKLYYTLLAEQIPPAKIAATIRSTLKCFMPSLDIQSIQLPSEGCASYMRRQELATVTMANKASCVAKQAQFGKLHLNSDGTTKSQKKLEGVAINGIVISVNEVPDGTADSMIESLSEELKKL